MPTLTTATSFSEIDKVRIRDAWLGELAKSSNPVSKHIKFDLFHLLRRIEELLGCDVNSFRIQLGSFSKAQT